MSVRTITLRTATVLAATALAALPLAGIASAAPAADLDCPDFPSQAAAQAAFDATPGDPNNLDADNDGKACENTDYGSSSGAATTSPLPATNERTGSAGSGSSGSGSTTSGSSTSSGDDQVTAVPAGSVDAGDGSALAAGPGADAAGGLVLAGFGAVAAAGAGTAVWRTRCSHPQRRGSHSRG